MRRRTVLGSALAATLAGTAAAIRPAAAQDGAADLAGHPLVGTWAVASTGGIVPQTHGPDGSVVAAFTPNYIDPALGLTFQGTALGRWEATGDRTARFTALQALSDAAGTYVGSFLLAASMEVSEDGQTCRDSGQGPRIVVRDAANNVVVDLVEPLDSPVTATRMGATAESVVLPIIAPGAATPAIGTPTA